MLISGMNCAGGVCTLPAGRSESPIPETVRDSAIASRRLFQQTPSLNLAERTFLPTATVLENVGLRRGTPALFDTSTGLDQVSLNQAAGSLNRLDAMA